MIRTFLKLVITLGLTVFFYSCGSLNQNTMFKTKGSVISDSLQDAINNVERNYIVKRDDYIDVQVFTNKGERLVDPNQEMVKQLGGGTAPASTNSNERVKYLVENTGDVRLPLIGRVKAEGYNLRQLDSILQTKYLEFYEDAFVLSRILNKRVFVLGNTGNKAQTMGRVVPLENENMTVIEVLTIAGGLDEMAKAYNVRLIRGDLKNPNVYLIDLSTIEGVRKSQLKVQPNDIIYVERQRRVLNQILTELSPLIMLINTALLIYITTRTRL